MTDDMINLRAGGEDPLSRPGGPIPLGHDQPTIDIDRLPRDVGGILRCQECDETCNVRTRPPIGIPSTHSAISSPGL